MDKYKILIFLLKVCLLFACNTSDKSKLFVEVKNVNFIYSRPDVLSDRDTLLKFKTYVFFEISCLINNPTSEGRDILLNNLMIKNYSFDVKMDFMGKEVFLYNYPFSAIFFPDRNKQFINGFDSISVSLQSPLVFSFKEANLKKMDSLFQLVKRSKFSLILNQIQDANIFFDNNKIKYGLVPISDKCFLSNAN